jgi:hypothetical protein
MPATLAQANLPVPNTNLFEVITNLFSRGDMLAHPQDMVPQLEALGIVWGIIFVIAGLLCLFNGFRYYKTVVIVMALAIGLFAGYGVGQHLDAAGSRATDAPYIIGGCCGVLLAAICLPLMKYAVAVMGGLIGAFVGANAWSAIALQAANGNAAPAANHYWVGALVGLLLVGMLAFILFKLSVVLFTSVSGSTLAVLGAVALLLEVPQWRGTITDSIQSHALIVPLLVLVPALIGLILQEASPKAAEEGK